MDWRVLYIFLAKIIGSKMYSKELSLNALWLWLPQGCEEPRSDRQFYITALWLILGVIVGKTVIKEVQGVVTQIVV